MGSIIQDINNIVVLENYSSSDASLIISKSFGRSFGDSSDYVEMHVYSPNNTLLYSNYNFTGYGIPGTIQGTNKTSYLNFNPDIDLENLGYAVGTFNVQYNILRNRINTSATPTFFISDISPDRTEIRVISNTLSNAQIESSSIQFIADIQSSNYYRDFLLDFGHNEFYIGVNVALDTNTNPYSLLLKLYGPLASTVNINDSFWIVEELSDPYSYSVQLFPDPITGSSLTIGPPNFDLKVDNMQIRSSDYVNYQELLSANSQTTYNLILSRLNQNNVVLNIDYSDFCNFVHFSSAKQRLLNFYFKIQQIENYTSQIAAISGSNNSVSVSASINSMQVNISNILAKFDGYDNYLYYCSESNAWPKSNDSLPYSLYPSTSSQIQLWLGSDDSFSPTYGGMINSASFYDSENPNNLVYSIPEYLRIDPANNSYELFVEMIGQHFDYIWTYIKAFGDIYKANNSLNRGISKDLVYYMLSSFGIKLYNNQNNQDLYQYLLGVTNSGSYTYPTSSYETLITSSQYTSPGQNNIKELFKRIYHNVPYLLKTKGTQESLRVLSTAFGIPSTIMRFTEYGGKDKTCSDTQYSFDRFSYALNTEGSGSVNLLWDELNLNDVTGQASSFANTIEFRFKPNPVYGDQILFEVGDGSNPYNFGLQLAYSSSNDIPYGNIIFSLNDGSGSYVQSDYISLPIFYTGSSGEIPWWNVMIRRRNQYFTLENDLIDFDIQYVINNDSSLINVGEYSTSGSGDQYYDIFVKNVINGNIGHQGSASVFVSQSLSSSYNSSWDTSATFYLGSYLNSVPFNGLFQELRFWNAPLYQNTFNKHVLNPESIEGINSGSFYNNLAGWFPLGNDLYTYDHVSTSSVNSVHPNRNSTFPSASFLGFNDYNNYVSNNETYYANVPAVGAYSSVTDKIRIEDIQISGSVLSPYIRLEEQPEFPLTKDLHFVNVSFSPQNEIDEDIIASLGNTFNIDNYIGDPHQENNSSYTDLDNLRELYFQRYISKYDISDYIRLIKYFDNALFKMLDDYVAARAVVQTGIVIRPTILERAKIKRYQPEAFTFYNFSCSIGNACLCGDSIYTSGYGDGSDFFTGELSGSYIDVYDDFEIKNYNPYILGNGNTDIFKGSDFDVLLNNVELNVTSSTRLKVDEINTKLLVPTQLQDYYYSYKRQILPRYIGSKSTSYTTNFYTSASYSGSVLIWPGDSSYGKNAAIDSNTLKFGWVKTIPSSSLNFFDKTSIILKYLVDPSGSLTELSRHNYNLFEVQNTFKSGNTTIVSLSDIISPSNQTTLDGDKIIFEGGFSYWPIVYRETAEQLHFDYLTSINSTVSISLTAVQQKLFQYNTNPGSGPDKEIDDDTSGGSYTLTYGTSNLSSGQFAFTHIAPFSSWSYANVPGLKEMGSVTFPSGAGGGSLAPGLPFTTPILDDNNQYVYQLNNLYFNLNDHIITNDSNSEYVQLLDGSYAYKVPRTSMYNIQANIPFNVSIKDTAAAGTVLKLLAVIERNTGSNAQGAWEYVDSSTFSYIEASQNAQYCWNYDKSLAFLDFDSWNGGNDYPLKALCSINGNYSFNANDYVRLSFFIIRLNNFLPTNNVDYAKLSVQNRFSSPQAPTGFQAGIMTITDTVNYANIVTTDGYYTDSVFFSISGSQENTLVFTDSASLLYGQIIFDEASVSSSTSLLYSPIDYSFTFEVGDVIRLTSYYSNNPIYYRVNQVITPITGSGGIVQQDLALILDKPIIGAGNISSNFVIFRRLPDETSVILNFQKNPGDTSQALLIPYDLDLGAKTNVANIATQISQQIAALK